MRRQQPISGYCYHYHGNCSQDSLPTGIGPEEMVPMSNRWQCSMDCFVAEHPVQPWKVDFWENKFGRRGGWVLVKLLKRHGGRVSRRFGKRTAHCVPTVKARKTVKIFIFKATDKCLLRPCNPRNSEDKVLAFILRSSTHQSKQVLREAKEGRVLQMRFRLVGGASGPAS